MMPDKKYKPVVYSVAIELPKPQSDVFAHLINLKKWWPEDFEGEDIKPGSEFIFRTGDSHYSKSRVIEFVPCEKFTWVTTEAIRKTDGYDWSGTKKIFELSPEMNGTLISFTYDGIVFENEYNRLVMICDITLKELFLNYVMNDKTLDSKNGK